MRRALPLLLLAAGCRPGPSAEDILRGREVFGPCALRAAKEMAEELRATDPGHHERLSKEAAGGDLARVGAEQILRRYGAWLALGAAEAEALRAGRVDENVARSRINAAWAAFPERGLEIPEVCRHLGEAARAGKLRGIDLEFASRILAGQVARPEPSE